MLNNSIKADTSHMEVPQSSHFENGRFHNVPPVPQRSTSENLALWVRFFTEKKVDTVPESAIPVVTVTRTQLNALPNDDLFVIKLGHSSVLLKNHGEYWLFDPVFGERASPFSFAGPKRFHNPPIQLEDLPEIERVFISHNHYDHLDKPSIKLLKDKTQHFYVPQGVEGDLQKWGVAESKIQVFDWWQETTSGQHTIRFTPTQHFSGRAMGDGNQTLWGSWAITSHGKSLYFSGDSGYFKGFKAIGERYGPFDLAMIETGAYDKDWAHIHMTPEQSVQAHQDLNAKVMVPIHNGTFDLAFHTWKDPLDRVAAAAEAQNVTLSTPIFGEVFTVKDVQTKRWWQGMP
ncbi:MBL fold metallo-hydrolase [Rhodanobacter aciditrophus]|uniref:MBL fold metallo-hydrolase n=1 Tax=Rhodanobacter aciditrophus TaxID=1623218 RepID=A0ABW4B0A0_9GAMM